MTSNVGEYDKSEQKLFAFNQFIRKLFAIRV